MARPREFNEAQVVQDAMGVFWEKGYAQTSVQDLVEATGLHRGSLYGAFGDKRGLYFAALDAYMTSGLQGLRGAIDSAPDPVEAVREFVRSSRGRSLGPTGRMGCMLGNTCSELAGQDEHAREQVAGFQSAMQVVLADALRRGQASGSFPSDRDPEAVATFLQCSLQGLALLGKTHPETSAIDRVVDEILRTLS